jgi:hypothetical protein
MGPGSPRLRRCGRDDKPSAPPDSAGIRAPLSKTAAPFQTASQSQLYNSGKVIPGVSGALIFSPSQSHGGQPITVQRRGCDVVEREHGTSTGLSKPTRSRRYNVKRVKNPLFEAGEERSRGRGMQAHPPLSPICPFNARAIPRPQPSIVFKEARRQHPRRFTPALMRTCASATWNLGTRLHVP